MKILFSAKHTLTNDHGNQRFSNKIVKDLKKNYFQRYVNLLLPNDSFTSFITSLTRMLLRSVTVTSKFFHSRRLPKETVHNNSNSWYASIFRLCKLYNTHVANYFPMSHFQISSPFNDMSKDNLSIPTGTCKLCSITWPGNVKDWASIGFLQSVWPLKELQCRQILTQWQLVQNTS